MLCPTGLVGRLRDHTPGGAEVEVWLRACVRQWPAPRRYV